MADEPDHPQLKINQLKSFRIFYSSFSQIKELKVTFFRNRKSLKWQALNWYLLKDDFQTKEITKIHHFLRNIELNENRLISNAFQFVTKEQNDLRMTLIAQKTWCKKK